MRTGQESSELFAGAFATLNKLKVEGFRHMHEMGNLGKFVNMPNQPRDTGTKVGLMTLLCGNDYTNILKGPAPVTYPDSLIRKLGLLAGPHGGVWAALRLREEGYRLEGDIWMKGNG